MAGMGLHFLRSYADVLAERYTGVLQIKVQKGSRNWRVRGN